MIKKSNKKELICNKVQKLLQIKNSYYRNKIKI